MAIYRDEHDHEKSVESPKAHRSIPFKKEETSLAVMLLRHQMYGAEDNQALVKKQ